MVKNCHRWALSILGLSALLLSPDALSKQPERPMLAAVRLGDHGASTRIVLDLKNGAAAYVLQPGDDRQTILVALQAGAVQPILPRHGTGLVRSVAVEATGDATHITITADQPVSLAADGALDPTAANPYHRIYIDLAVAPGDDRTPPPSMTESPLPRTIGEAAPLREAAAPEPAPEPAPHGLAAPPESPPHRLVVDGTEHGGAESGEAEAPEVTAIVKIGGSQEWSLNSADQSRGPTLAVEKAVFHDSLEIEAGVTPLYSKGRAEWKTGLIVKKPVEIAERTEFEVGLGPLWLRKTDGDSPINSAGAEAVMELVNWPWASKRLGWYVESGYAYNFGKGHESSLGAGAGLLISIP